jgi:hypothetical protein
MVMKNYLALGLVLIIVVIASGCTQAPNGGNGGATPTGVYMSYRQAIVDGDEQVLIQHASEAKAQQILTEFLNLTQEQIEQVMVFLKGFLPENLVIVDENIDGNTATLTATGIVIGLESNGTITMVKEQGQWKLESEVWIPIVQG